MVTIVKIKQSIAEFVKFLRFGNVDIQTASQMAAFGIDSKPLPDDVGVHSTTSNKDESIVLGYIYSFENTNPGEIRIYCKNQQGIDKFSMYFKNDGIVEFGGNTDNLVKYSELNNGLQNQDSQINAELLKIQIAITTLGGVYTAGTINTNITNSKIDNIKV